MSAWVNFRNSVEALFEPEVQEAVNFAHAVKSDSEAAAGGNIMKAFTASTSAFVSSAGSLEAKVFAAIGAFAATLLGYEVAIIRKDAAAAVTSTAAS